jgi:hypothetical protein
MYVCPKKDYKLLLRRQKRLENQMEDVKNVTDEHSKDQWANTWVGMLLV